MTKEEDRFKKMVEDSQDWFWEFDENAVFTYSSPRISDLLGYEPEEILGLNAFDLMTADEAERVHKHFDPIAEKYLPFNNLINTNIHKDGHEVVVESSGTPIFDKEGRFRGYRGIDRDITERTHTEDLLRENTSKLKDIIETSTEWIWEMDAFGRYTYSNDALGSILGYSAEEFIERAFSDFLHVDDLAEVSRILPKYIEEKRGWQGWALRWKHKDGSYRWLESNANVVIGTSGQVKGFRGSDRDVTERKRILEELSASKEKLNDIVTLLPQAIYEADINGKLIFVNRAAFELFGYNEVDLAAGLNVLDMFVPEEVQKVRGNVDKLYWAKAEGSHEYTAQRKDGSTFPVIIYSNVVMRENEPVGIRGVIVNISKRKKYEQELEKARDAAESNNRAKDEFLANMSHELRTPITAILGFSELLEGTELSEKQQKYLATIITSSESLLGLVNDLLDIAKIEAGMVQLDSKEFNLRRLVSEIIHSQKPAAKAKKITLKSLINGNTPETLVGDPLRLKQILLNLVVNAIKFTKKGQVLLTVKVDKSLQSSDIICFDVTDTGGGMKKEDIDKIFRPFSQLDTSPSRSFSGAGLGLTICSKLSAIMEGGIEVDTTEGIGSSFLVRLPFERGGISSEGGEYSTKKRVDVSDDTPLQILLVEDYAGSRQFFTEALKRYGHEVDQAKNGAEALEKLHLKKYDITLMDLQMPVMDGMEAIKRIRAREKGTGEHIPVIALTAHAMEKDRVEVQSKGFDGYISKPLKIFELLAEIKRCLT